MDRLEADAYSTDDEERRLEHAVGHYIDQALATGHEAEEGEVVAVSDGDLQRGQVMGRYQRDGSRDREGDDDLFGDDTQGTEHTLEPSHGAVGVESWQTSPPSSSTCHPTSMLASTTTSCPSTPALMLPSGTGRPLIFSTRTPQPPKPKPRPLPPSHAPRRLSGNDYKRLRLQREAEFKEAQEKLSRGEITAAQMPAPVRQRMSRRKKEMLKEQKELEGAVWSVRSDFEAASASSSPVAMSRGASLEGAPSVESDDDDDEVRALALSAWDGTRRTSASIENGSTSTTASSPAGARSSLPPPLFATPAGAASSPSLPSTPKTLLNVVLKRGPDQDWIAAAAAMQSLPSSPCRAATSAPSPSCDNGSGMSRQQSAMSISPDPQSSVPTSHRNFAPGRGSSQLPAQEHIVQGPRSKEKWREQIGPANSSPLPVTKASSASADSIPKDLSSSFSPYTAPLRTQLHLSRQRITARVKMHQTDLNRLKLEAEVLKNASRVVDSRILELERRKRERILARDAASRSARDAKSRETR